MAKWCGKCAGKGRIIRFTHRLNGLCYRCNGKGFTGKGAAPAGEPPYIAIEAAEARRSELFREFNRSMCHEHYGKLAGGKPLTGGYCAYCERHVRAEREWQSALATWNELVKA